MTTLDKDEQIRQSIEKAVDDLFTEILELLKPELESSLDKSRLQGSKWKNSIKQLMFISKRSIGMMFKEEKLDNEKRKVYWSYWDEQCQKKKAEAENDISWLKDNFDIPLLKYSIAPIEIKDITATHTKLLQGAELLAFKQALHKFWKKQFPLKLNSPNGNLRGEQKQLLLRQFIAGLIFECGCAHQEDLIAILQSLIDTYSLHGGYSSPDLYSGLVSVYSGTVHTTAGFVYSYALKSKRYASIYLDQTGYVSKQIYLSPLCLFMLIRLAHILQEEANQIVAINQESDQLQNMILALCEKDSNSLDQYISVMIAEVDSTNTLAKHFKLKKYKAFRHIDYVQWFAAENRLDGFSSALHQGAIKTSCLSWRLLDELNVLNTLTDEQLKARMQGQLSASKMKQNPIAYQKVPVQKVDSKNEKIEKVCKSLIKGFKGQVKAQVLQEIEQNLFDINESYELREGMSAKDVALLAVQKCLLEWYRIRLKEPYGGRSLKLSSLDTYKSAFVSDLFYYAVTNDFNLLEMDEAQFEELYEYILSEKQFNDESRGKREKTQNSNQKQHNSYGNAVVALKQFHQFLVEHYHVTSVSYLNEIDDGHGLQICKATYVTPALWALFLKVLEWRHDLLDQQKTMIRLICTLAYRAGLRIGEVLGLRISDLVMMNLHYPETKEGKFYSLDTKPITYLKIQIRNNYHRQIKTANAKRALALHHFLTKDEFDDLVAFLKTKFKYESESRYCETCDGFIFSDQSDQMIASSFISQLCKFSFDTIFNHSNHDYSFHTFRHTTANNMAMILFASHELNKTWNDYDHDHRRRIQSYIFMHPQNKKERGVYSNQWQLLAHFLGHSSITMTANHYLHFGLMLYADACSHEMFEGSDELLRQILHSKVFGYLGLSISVIAEQSVEIIKRLRKKQSKRKIKIMLDHAIYPNQPSKKGKRVVSKKDSKNTTSKVAKPSELQKFINLLQGSSYIGWDQSLKSSVDILLAQLYKNRKFEQKHKQNSYEDDVIKHTKSIVNYMDVRQYLNTEQNDSLKVLQQLIRNTQVLDYFKHNIRIYNAQLEVYITSKKDLYAYHDFCVRLKKLYPADVGSLLFENRNDEDLERRLKSFKRQKGEVLVIRNRKPKGNVCQKIIGMLFLACLYRSAQKDVK